jgi:putative MATE family efflux protein
VPALISMTLNALYSVVDRLYVANGCGEDAIAGITIAFPVMMVFVAVGVFIGMGHASLLSIKLGQRNMDEAEKTLGECVALKLLSFLILPPLAYAFMDEILGLCGGNTAGQGAMDAARQYLKITLISHFFSHLAFGLSATMRSEGAAKRSMLCMIVGFGTNLILDPILIFKFRLGIAGAAWATVIAMFLSMCTALHYYLSGSSVVKLRLSKIRIHREIFMRAAAIGIAPFLQQISGALINLSLAAALGFWAADKDAATLQLAALGIFQTVMMIFLMPVLGLQQGVSPIIGFNWGAKNFSRVKEALILALKLITAVCTFAAVVQIFWSEELAWLFAEKGNSSLINAGAYSLRVSNFMLWCIGLNISMTTYFQAIGRAKTAILLSLLRQLICMVPCIWILPIFCRPRELGVWLTMPCSDILACLATLPFFIKHLRFLNRTGNIRKHC